MSNTDRTQSTSFSANGHIPTSFDHYLDGSLIPPEAAHAGRLAAETQHALLQQGISDEGNAQCTTLLYPGRFLHNDAFGWLYYDDRQWILDNAEATVDRSIVDTLTKRVAAATQSGELEKYEKLVKFCIPNRPRVQGAKYLLQSLVVASPHEFDTEPDLLNCRNGVIDLRSGELHPHAPTPRFTHCATVDYIPDADAGPWERWLLDAVGGDQGLVEWLQMAVGYSLTGHTNEEILFYLYGPPRAGKGLFTETLLALLGPPLAKEVNFATFTAQRTGDSQNFDLAPLKPCRLVAASESNAYERFNEAKVKALTGGNEIYCAFKHRNHFNYRPQFKIWLSSNQPVNADPDDDAVWGRIRLIEFPNSHLGKEDKRLKGRMKKPAMLQGVLVWAVQGAIKWYSLGGTGLPELEVSVQLKAKHRADLDEVQAWLDEECELGQHYFTSNSEIYQSYTQWCESNGVTPKKKKGLTQALGRKRLTPTSKKIEGKTKRGIVGLRIV